MLWKTATWTTTWIFAWNGMAEIWIIRLDQLRAKLRLKDRWVSQTDLTLDHKRKAMSFITSPAWYLHDSYYGSHGCSSIPSVSPAFGEAVAPKGPRAETWATEEHSYTSQKNTESLLVELWHVWRFLLPTFWKPIFSTKVLNLAFLLQACGSYFLNSMLC